MRASCATLLVVLFACSTPASAEKRGITRGFSTNLNLGVNFLIPIGDNPAYDQLDPSFGMNLGLMYRFGNLAGLQLNYMLGLYDTPSTGGAGSAYARFMALTLGPRFFIDAGPVEVFIDLGTGWDMLSVGASGGGMSIDSTIHGIDVMLGVGVEYKVLDGLSVGLGFQYHFPFYFYGCVSSTGEGEQCDTDSVDVDQTPHDFMFGASITVYWSKLFGTKATDVKMVEGGQSSLATAGDRMSGTTPRRAAAPRNVSTTATTRSADPSSSPGPSGPTQRRMLPPAFSRQDGKEAQLGLGDVRADVIDAFDMPAKLDRQGENVRLVYGPKTDGLEGFRQVIFLFGPNKKLHTVDFSPSRGIAQATIREKLGKPTKVKHSKQGTQIWIYAKYSLTFFFKPESDQAYHVRLKAY